jgi:phosphoglycolate phosphatase
MNHMTTVGSRPEAMIFDVDGTLFQTETLLISAYHAVFNQLREEGLYVGPTPPEERILSCLGMLLPEIWRKVMPEASEAAHRRADVLLLQYELEGLANGEGRLYEGVEETLTALRSQGIRLFTASNGLEAYVKGVIRDKGLQPLFEENGLYSAGQYETATKAELVQRLLKDTGVASAWMVGDRSSDVEAGLACGLTVVGCDYAGFRHEGELEGSHFRIGTFDELISLVNDAK